MSRKGVAIMAQGQSSGKGRGWHGDSAGHAAAGRQGGRARGRRRGSSTSNR
jgi:hypothetical protein